MSWISIHDEDPSPAEIERRHAARLAECERLRQEDLAALARARQIREDAVRRRARVDTNQKEMVEELRHRGYSVVSIASMGKGIPDLIVGRWGHNLLVEVKRERNKAGDPENLTDDEKLFFAEWKGSVVVATDADQVDDWFFSREPVRK